jgi:hypothetical protein
MTKIYRNIKTEDPVFEEFEKLRSDLRFKYKMQKTQTELVKMLINFWKVNNKKEKSQ